ncbi:hypothetical protein [Eubacterium oxidoreducens]|uniref:Uncharacterized protein n=1 Tax=Eubacterium oxidoreducens TaxID=1732 RepID=A0A1G6AU35_EUBOX|nr:hypothetical protein [Eubacterium oxidoreducens]SDB11890.1 hypothetical protein SAMN02910417_00888 [Eubacterium oxidoreducens]
MQKTMADRKNGGWRLENQPWWQEYSKTVHHEEDTQGLKEALWQMPTCGSFSSSQMSLMRSGLSYLSVGSCDGGVFLLGYGLHLI